MSGTTPDPAGATDGLLVDVDHRGVVAITLNRPKVRNALDAAALTSLIELLGSQDPQVRAIVIRAVGPVFSAGVDLMWLRELEARGEKEAAANLLSELEAAFERTTVPVVVVAQGPVLGAAIAILASADVTVASTAATVCVPEVKAGVVPSGIVPLLIQRVGPGWARYLAIRGESCSAPDARTLGLLHHVVDVTELDVVLAQELDALLSIDADVCAATKRLFLST